jgi:hypothetical protein
MKQMQKIKLSSDCRQEFIQELAKQLFVGFLNETLHPDLQLLLELFAEQSLTLAGVGNFSEPLSIDEHSRAEGQDHP